LHEILAVTACDLEELALSGQAREVKKRHAGQTALLTVERIVRTIVRLRGQNVMLDADLATLYQVDVRVLNLAVKRSRERFPADFMFQLTAQEAESLRSQIVILKVVFQAIRELMAPAAASRKRIGFQPEKA
jgi:hypothetical protein